MKSLTNTETALLALIAEKPRHPYQIEQEVQYREMRFWTELSMSSIYKLLRKFEEEKFVKLTKNISSENRLQKLYSITPLGLEALKEKLVLLISEPEHLKWQVDIGTYNAGLLPKDVVISSLIQYKKGLETKITEYNELHNFLTKSNCPYFHLALSIRPVFLLKAEIKWVDDFIKNLK